MSSTETHRRAPGRPSKLPQVRDELVELLSSGVSIAAACAEVGISPRTYSYWMQAGELTAIEAEDGRDADADGQQLMQFFRDATRARARFEVVVTQRLNALVLSDEVAPRDLLDVLQRLNRERWSKSPSVQTEDVADSEFAQRFASVLIATVRSVLDALVLTPEQHHRAQAVVPQVLRRHMREHEV